MALPRPRRRLTPEPMSWTRLAKEAGADRIPVPGRSSNERRFPPTEFQMERNRVRQQRRISERPSATDQAGHHTKETRMRITLKDSSSAPGKSGSGKSYRWYQPLGVVAALVGLLLMSATPA